MKKPQIVVVTGASAGVGRAITREFSRHGAWMGLIARCPERLQATSEEVEREGGKALAISADVSDPNQVEEAATKIEQELGAIDIWINCAMATIFSPFLEISPEEYKRATEVTYLGTVYGTMAALKRMKPRNSGVILQVGSALSYRAIPIQAPYCGAKFAIRGFTDSIRSELIHSKSKVHITMVQLPAVNTPQFSWCAVHIPKHPRPVPPVYEPELIARAVYWSAHHRRRETFLGFSSIQAIWGNKVSPWFLDRYLAKKAWDGQMSTEPVRPDRPNNLFHYVPGNYEAHGEFAKEAKRDMPEFWLTRNRNRILAGIVVLGLLLCLIVLR